MIKIIFGLTFFILSIPVATAFFEDSPQMPVIYTLPSSSIGSSSGGSGDGLWADSGVGYIYNKSNVLIGSDIASYGSTLELNGQMTGVPLAMTSDGSNWMQVGSDIFGMNIYYPSGWLFSSDTDYLYFDATGISLGLQADGVQSADSTIDLHGNTDFNSYKAIAMVCDNGATLPTTAVKGQWFLHTPTGRTILMMYDGSTWKPIYSFGTMQVYVNGTGGTDDQNYGYDFSTHAFKTIQFAINQIPPTNAGNVYINLSRDVFSEPIVIQGKSYTGAYGIYLYGYQINKTSALVSNTPTTYTQGGTTSTTGPDYSTIAKTGIFAGRNLTGMFIQYGSAGNYYVINNNTDDKIWIADNTISSVSSFKIFNLSSANWYNSGIGLSVGQGQQGIYVYNMNFSNTGTSSTFDYSPFSYVTMINNIVQGGNNQNGGREMGGKLDFFRSYIYQTNSNKFALTTSSQGVATLTNSLCRLSGSATTCLRMNQLSFVAGNPSYYAGSGSGTAFTMLGGQMTLFGQSITNFATCVSADGASTLTYQNPLYAKFNRCSTAKISKTWDTYGSGQFQVKADNSTQKMGIGYDSTGEFVYMNYQTSTTANNFVLDNTGYIGLGDSSPSYKLEVNGTIGGYGMRVNNTIGQSKTVTVRDSAGTGTCTLVYTGGLYTGGTC